MFAFYKFGDFLIKVYLVDNNWQVKGNCIRFSETWASVWRDDIEDSLKHAISRHCELNNIPFYDDVNFLTIV